MCQTIGCGAVSVRIPERHMGDAVSVRHPGRVKVCILGSRCAAACFGVRSNSRAMTSPVSRSTSAPASRLAEPGEILVSQTVRDALVGSGVEWTSRGVHHLKGVPDEWRTYAVANSGALIRPMRRGHCDRPATA